MNPWKRAHSPKLEVPTDREQVERELLNEYRWRRYLWRAGEFRGVDPLTPGQRERAACYLERERKDASIFLACRAARAKYPSDDPVEISPSANIPPGVYRHIGGGLYESKRKVAVRVDSAAGQKAPRSFRAKLRVIPGGRS